MAGMAGLFPASFCGAGYYCRQSFRQREDDGDPICTQAKLWES
jgi:hypothetical protein